MQTQQTKNRFSGPKSYRDFEETGPCAELFMAGLKLARVSAKFEFRRKFKWQIQFNPFCLQFDDCML